MSRINKDMYYLNIAREVALRSTCLRRRYGAVIVKNDEIISTGYNGAPRNEENCIDCGYCAREAMGVAKGERYELCLAGETVVKLLDGSYRTIRDLAENGPAEFWLYAVDTKTGGIVPAKGVAARKTGFAATMCKITFDNGKTLLCTKDHRILMRDCTYKEAENLVPGDSVMPMYSNHKVVKVEYVPYNDDVFDLTVPGYENFAVDLGDNSCVFVHNCVAVHAESNAIISAARRDMLGGTIYITGLETDGSYANPAPCIMCRRLIKNAGIVKCIGMVDGEPKEIPLDPPKKIMLDKPKNQAQDNGAENALGLKPCRFCKSPKVKVTRKCVKEGCNGLDERVERHTFSVRCNFCHARGPAFGGLVIARLDYPGVPLPDWATSDEDLQKKAIDAWNANP